MIDPVPTFVVTGNVNQGKSSVVSALIESETVPVDSYPGTTADTAVYAFRLGDAELFRIVDTPGFQDARETLAWLQQRAANAGERPAAVRAFVEAHDGSERFVDEVRLLRPILAGAGVIYVVDASTRFQPSNEAEMEILRWTGQPSMALVNRTRERDFAADWRPILEQFFNIVRDFDAHRAGFGERMELLRGFRELHPSWRQPIERAVAAIEDDWRQRTRRAAQVLADYVVRAMGHLEKRQIEAEGAPPDSLEAELTTAYRSAQRRYEADARSEIERIYHHETLVRDGSELSLLDADLFAEESWRLFGLDRAQLAKYGAAWGAVIGGGIDLAVGGMSFFLGAAAGAGIGALTGYFGGTQIAKTSSAGSPLAKILFAGETGRFVFKGPVTNPRYAWMLLDRALVHFASVRSRSHARRDPLRLDDDGVKQGIVSRLPAAERDRIDKVLREVLAAVARAAPGSGVRQQVADALESLLLRLE